MDIQALFAKTVEYHASDLHIMAGYPPMLRVEGNLIHLPDTETLTREMAKEMLLTILSEPQKEFLINNRGIDFSYGFGGGDYGNQGRFRANIYFQKATLAGDFRLLPFKVRTIEELGLPPVCHSFAKHKQGLILVTGPTGHGKTTTLASIINEINMTEAKHILTIEDPIEYIYPRGKCIISQREIQNDTHSWTEALRSALREDPDVVMVGEMRDPESIAATITLAETGHLVFSTLHTNSASQSVDRIIDVFPPNQQNEIRAQLGSILQGVISQRLIPRVDGARAVAAEILIGTNAVRANIREGKTHLIDSILQTSADEGMITFESSLAQLVKDGYVTLEIAESYSLRKDELAKLLT